MRTRWLPVLLGMFMCFVVRVRDFMGVCAISTLIMAAAVPVVVAGRRVRHGVRR